MRLLLCVCVLFVLFFALSAGNVEAFGKAQGGRVVQSHYGNPPYAGYMPAYVRQNPDSKTDAPSRKKACGKGKKEKPELGMEDPDRLFKMVVAVVLGILMSMFLR